jgi:hypothetical protein
LCFIGGIWFGGVGIWFGGVLRIEVCFVMNQLGMEEITFRPNNSQKNKSFFEKI